MDTSISPTQILNNLKMGFLGALEAQKGSWGAFTDVMYLNLGDLGSRSRIQSIGGIGLPVGASASTSFDLKSWVWTLAGSYRVIAQPDSTLDVLAGARLLDITMNLGFQLSGNIGPIPLPGRSGSAEVSESIWDAIIGVKGHVGLGADGKWFVPYYLDVGTGQSKLNLAGNRWHRLCVLMGCAHRSVALHGLPREIGRGGRQPEFQRAHARVSFNW